MLAGFQSTGCAIIQCICQATHVPRYEVWAENGCESECVEREREKEIVRETEKERKRKQGDM